MDNSRWKDVDWKYVKDNYPDAQVLKSGQDFERPTEWPALEDVTQIREKYTSNSE
jgi:hypothetical protein